MIEITVVYIVIMVAGIAVAGMNYAKYKKRNKELYNCNTDLNMERIRLENELKKLSKEKQEGRVTGLYCHKCEHGISTNSLSQIQCELNIDCTDYERKNLGGQKMKSKDEIQSKLYELKIYYEQTDNEEYKGNVEALEWVLGEIPGLD